MSGKLAKADFVLISRVWCLRLTYPATRISDLVSERRTWSDSVTESWPPPEGGSCRAC